MDRGREGFSNMWTGGGRVLAICGHPFQCSLFKKGEGIKDHFIIVFLYLRLKNNEASMKQVQYACFFQRVFICSKLLQLFNCLPNPCLHGQRERGC